MLAAPFSGPSVPPSPIGPALAAPPEDASYRVALQTPAGELPFVVAFEDDRAFVLNGEERLTVERFTHGADGFTLEFPHYDSRLEARPAPEGGLLGTWTKVRGADRVAEVPLSAKPGGRLTRFGAPEGGVAGSEGIGLADPLPERWTLRFESSDVPAVGLFERVEGVGSPVRGTILTHVGDYRFLDGVFRDGRLQLSCFDGAHAFLFDARIAADGGLTGTFQSGDWWTESFSGTPDPDAQLPDAFAQVEAIPGASLFGLTGLDRDGQERAVLDLGLAGRPFIVQVFGSWCPNCHDEGAFLGSRLADYRERGVGYLGLAFELTGRVDRDLEQMGRFVDRHGIDGPVLWMGTANKRDAAEALGLLDAVLSFPTTLFVDAYGEVRAVHSGFSGPATGAEHELLAAEFDRWVDDLTSVAPWGDPRPPLGITEWNEWGGPGRGVRFATDGGSLTASFVRDPEEEGTETTLDVAGPRVALANRAYFVDPAAGVLLDPLDVGQRLTPRGDTRAPAVWSWGEGPREILARAKDGDALALREAVIAVLPRLTDSGPEGLEVARLARESSAPGVRAALAWGLGEAGATEHSEWLIEQLDSPHAPLRRESARAIGRIGSLDGEQLQRALFELLKGMDDPLPSVSDAAEAARTTLAVASELDGEEPR